MSEHEVIECPSCPRWETPRGVERGVEMDEIETNYSGCGVDIYECPKCHKRFQVSYKVDEITEI